MKVVMVGPVPGIAPNSVPISVPRSVGKNACFSSALLGRMSRTRTFMPLPTTCRRLTLRRNSATPNRPSAKAARSTRSDSSAKPKVKRITPVLTSVPTTPTNSPTTVIATPLIGEPRDIVPPARSPSSMIEKISAGPNLKAAWTKSGEAKIITMMPNEAAKNEAIMVIPSAVPPLPCRVIG
ncbi:hypothetical protein GALL_481970 [mine drainage metagenome]|uniref:Uncharacterized protein n=1 Tax=mine drainage metagenome TaxID=410659 RepID=A0A1J5PHD5_9ZZZZ